MSENDLFELANALGQTTELERSASAALASIKDVIEQNYLLKLRTAAENARARTLADPPREVTLLRAMTAFLDEKGKVNAEHLAENLLFLHTLRHVWENVLELAEDPALLSARNAQPREGRSFSDNAEFSGFLLMLALCRGL